MTTNQKFNELTSFIEEQMLEKGVPGVAFGILHKGETRIKGLGVTNVNHPLPVTAETLFQIGSNTKTFTGTLIMMLVQDGLVELDRPVSHYLPEFPRPRRRRQQRRHRPPPAQPYRRLGRRPL